MKKINYNLEGNLTKIEFSNLRKGIKNAEYMLNNFNYPISDMDLIVNQISPLSARNLKYGRGGSHVWIADSNNNRLAIVTVSTY